MITLSLSLERRIVREMMRHAGSEARFVFYSGTMPPGCEEAANGERSLSQPVEAEALRPLAEGTEPERPQGASYWRLLDNGGLVIMQGDWS